MTTQIRMKGNVPGDKIKEQGVAEGSEHNVGGISHSIIKHPGGKHQVVVKHGDKVAHTSLHNSEEDAKKSLASQVAHSKKMLKVDEQGVAEGVDKSALKQELDKINAQMVLTHPSRQNPNSPTTNTYFALKKQKDAIIAQLKQGVAEGHADQQRKVFKKNGKPVGKVGIDRESSPGNGQWYMKCYSNGIDNVGYDSYEEAVAELKHCIKQGVAEAGQNPHTSAIGKALYRALSKEKKASPTQVEKNKARWAQRQADKEQGVAEGSDEGKTGKNFAKIAPTLKPLTDEMVVAAARVLNERQADACGVDRDDQWAIYSDDFKADALAMLKAAHNIKEKNT